MQLHKRHSIEQVRRILDWYEQGLMSQAEALQKLGIKRRRFFSLLKAFRAGKLKQLTSKRSNVHRKLPSAIEAAIKTELQQEKRLINNPDIALDHYNYSAVRDNVVEQIGMPVSAQTVRRKAKAWGYHIPKLPAKAKHTRVVLTTATGLLLQHDASHHLW